MKYRHTLIVGLILGSAVVAFGSDHPYISDYGTLIEGFEDVDDWAVSGTGATATDDTSVVRSGTQSIKLNAVGGAVALITKESLSLDLSSGNGFPLWFYITDSSKLTSMTIFITSQSNFSKYFSVTISVYVDGWNYVVPVKSEFTNSGGESWDNTMVKMRFWLSPKAGEDASVNFDDFRFGISGQTKVILTFDDNEIGQIDNAYPIMAANGQEGVTFIYIDGVGAPRMTVANLQTLRDAGWDICNHTKSHPYLTSISQAEMEAEIDGAYDWLVANGFGDTAKFFAYPFGAYNDAVVTKLKQRHVLARIVSIKLNRAHFYISNFHDLQYKLSGYNVANTVAVADVNTAIDRAIERGGVLTLLFHKIVDVDADDSREYLTADFQIISDYLKTKQDAGELEVLTYSDYYNALIELEPFCLEKPAMDFNGDCKVDFADFALFTQSWLECNLDPESACWE